MTVASCSTVSARARFDDLGVGAEHRRRIGELADDTVVADSGQAHLGLRRRRGVTDEHDVALRGQHVAGPLGEATLQPDVDGAAEVTGGEVGRLAAVEQHGPGGLATEHVVERHRWRRVVVEQRAQLAVALGVELEVVRSRTAALR